MLFLGWKKNSEKSTETNLYLEQADGLHQGNFPDDDKTLKVN